MKMRKCPYCGRRISYTSSFASRRKAEYICQKCGKESKVAVDKKVICFYCCCGNFSCNNGRLDSCRSCEQSSRNFTRCDSAYNFYGSFTELRSL